MEASALTTILLPVALGIIMFGLGLGLTLGDFRRVMVYPRAVAVGLFVQMILLTAIAFGLAKLFALPPELAVGLMILAASPGGATANVFSNLARADVALNITLTAINSALALVWLPLVVNGSLLHFMGEGRYVPPPFAKIAEVAAIILVPVALGMVVRARAPAAAARIERPLRLFSILVLAALVLVALMREWGILGSALASVGLVCLIFNLLSLGAGYAAPRLLALDKRQSVAIAFEIGIHNGTLAIFIALNVLNSSPMSIPAAIYSLIMFATGAALLFLGGRVGKAA
jgi:BASS family bile acid:Na+ symporter